MQYLLKLIITSLTVVAVAEISKRYTVVATVFASLPLISILAIVWLYADTKEIKPVIEFSSKMFWAVLPSLLFFIVFPRFLKSGFPFITSLLLSIGIMSFAYVIYVAILKSMKIPM